MFEPVLSRAVSSGHPVLSAHFSESQIFFLFLFFCSNLIFTFIKQSPLLSFNSQDLISSSPYCLSYKSCDVSSEHWVLDQLIIP